MAEVVAKKIHRREVANKELEERERKDREAAKKLQMEEKDAYAEQLRLKEEEEFRRAKEQGKWSMRVLRTKNARRGRKRSTK